MLDPSKLGTAEHVMSQEFREELHKRYKSRLQRIKGQEKLRAVPSQEPEVEKNARRSPPCDSNQTESHTRKGKETASVSTDAKPERDQVTASALPFSDVSSNVQASSSHRDDEEEQQTPPSPEGTIPNYKRWSLEDYIDWEGNQ